MKCKTQSTNLLALFYNYFRWLGLRSSQVSALRRMDDFDEASALQRLTFGDNKKLTDMRNSGVIQSLPLYYDELGLMLTGKYALSSPKLTHTLTY